MSLFRFALYFAALIACAVAAYPSWVPLDADPDVPTAEAASPLYSATYRRAVAHARLSAPALPSPARIASRD